MRKFVAVAALGILISAALPGAVTGQDGSAVFVVYGTMYEEDGSTIVNDGYAITVELVLKDRFSTLNLGENDGPGRYSVVWIDYEGDLVVVEGDEVVVKADKEGEQTFGMNHIVTLDDIMANKVRIDIQRGMISADNMTWGAIKSMYK